MCTHYPALLPAWLAAAILAMVLSTRSSTLRWYEYAISPAGAQSAVKGADS